MTLDARELNTNFGRVVFHSAECELWLGGQARYVTLELRTNITGDLRANYFSLITLLRRSVTCGWCQRNRENPDEGDEIFRGPKDPKLQFGTVFRGDFCDGS